MSKATAYARKVSLIEVLVEKHEGVPEPPPGAIEAWSESQIKSWFEAGGTLPQPGGGQTQPKGISIVDKEESEEVKRRAIANTSERYREVALQVGIPHRPDGLFGHGDPLLAELLEDGFLPFEKHLTGKDDLNELARESWATGNEACKAGLDLRYFYKPGKPHGQLAGAVIFGDKARIGLRLSRDAHGGAIETALDEVTAELVKIDVAPFATTVEAKFKIKQAVPTGKTLRVRATIKGEKLFRVFVSGSLLTMENEELATCEAEVINLNKYFLMKE